MQGDAAMTSLHRFLIVALAAAGTLDCRTIGASRPMDAGFWFEDVSYDLIGSGGPLTRAEIAKIDTAAREEIARAFAGIGVRFSNRRDARYVITVVQHVYDLRVRRTREVFGNARAMRGLGGRGSVNFYAVASGAAAFAPADATRQDVIAGIGRGVGRVAIHEFTHLFLPKLPIDQVEDPLSFEYGHAARREQYYGELHWSVAREALLEAFES
jgi:hypothetical protein